MPEPRYALQVKDEKKIAWAMITNANISRKWAIELGRTISNLNVERARSILNDAIALKKPIAMRRFNTNVSHKSGRIAAGRYMVKAAQGMLELLESAIANASHSNLDTKKLVVRNVTVNKGTTYARPRIRWRPNRKKMANVQIVLEEK